MPACSVCATETRRGLPRRQAELVPAPDIFGTLIRSDENLCLDAAEPLTLSSRLHMWPCEPDNHKEIWNYRWDTKQVAVLCELFVADSLCNPPRSSMTMACA